MDNLYCIAPLQDQQPNVEKIMEKFRPTLPKVSYSPFELHQQCSDLVIDSCCSLLVSSSQWMVLKTS